MFLVFLAMQQSVALVNSILWAVKNNTFFNFVSFHAGDSEWATNKTDTTQKAAGGGQDKTCTYSDSSWLCVVWTYMYSVAQKFVESPLRTTWQAQK